MNVFSTLLNSTSPEKITIVVRTTPQSREAAGTDPTPKKAYLTVSITPATGLIKARLLQIP